MRYAILSDLHGNEPALTAVVDRLRGIEVDRTVCLGDLVGYNPFPVPCLRFSREHCDLTIRGNHDKAVAGVQTRFEMNEVAEAAIRWTREALSARQLRGLAKLRAGPITAGDGLLVCHGTPMDEDRYLVAVEDARESFEFLFARYPLTRFCAFGHTHVAVVVDERRGATVPEDGAAVRLAPGRRYLLNPGSVGQPRDGDPRAAFGILDTERLEFTVHRVAYPLQRTQERIRAEGLPDFLAERLISGR